MFFYNLVSSVVASDLYDTCVLRFLDPDPSLFVRIRILPSTRKKEKNLINCVSSAFLIILMKERRKNNLKNDRKTLSVVCFLPCIRDPTSYCC